MTDLHSRPDASTNRGEPQPSGHRHWAMIACCIPMLAIAIVLVATGVAGAGFIFAALICTLMMALMMLGMSGTGRQGGHHH